MTRRKRAADPPARGNHGERLQDEAPLFQSVMRDVQTARTKAAAAPQSDVDIQHARPPMLPGPPPELAFHRLNSGQHRDGLEIALDQRHGIGEVAPGRADGRVEKDRRGIEQAELLVQASDRALYDLSWAAEAAVRPV